MANVNQMDFKATGTTTSRTLGDRFADVINVKDFGAQGIGSGHDDTAAIQAAVNHFASLVGNGFGGRIYFPGVCKGASDTNFYNLTGTIDLPPACQSIVIEGDGMASKISATANFGFLFDDCRYAPNGTVVPSTTFVAAGNTSGSSTVINGSISSAGILTIGTLINHLNVTISGTTLTVNSTLIAGVQLGAGSPIIGAGISAGTVILNFISGNTWRVNNSQSVGPVNVSVGMQTGDQLNAQAVVVGSISGTVMNVTGVTYGTLQVGDTVKGSDGTHTYAGTIQSFGTGTGGTGTYNMSTSGTLNASTTITAVHNNAQPLQTQVLNLVSGSQGASGSTYQCVIYSGTGEGVTFRNLYLVNGDTSQPYTGGLRLANQHTCLVENVVFACQMVCAQFDTGCDNPLSCSFDTTVVACTCEPQNSVSGSIGFKVGANSAIIACDCSGHDCAIQMYGVANGVFGGRFEVNNNGIVLYGPTNFGITAHQPYSQSNGVLANFSLESNKVGIFFDQGGQVHVDNVHILGFGGAAPGGANPTHGINIQSGKAQGCTFTGLDVGGDFTVASIFVGDDTPATSDFNTFENCTASNSGALGGVAWSLPTHAGVAQFVNCNTTASYAFANLPVSPQDGDTYDITDCNTSTFLATAAGGGTGAAAHRRVKWNATATAWQVIG